jgi:hypothetical protein
MKLRLALVAVLLSAGSLAAAPLPQAQAAAVDTSKVDGKWTLDIITDQGSMSASLDLKSDGKKVTGTITSPQGEAPLEGEFADGKLAFGISIDTPEGAMQIGFAGAMKEDGTMAGTLSGPFGEAPWTAARVK